MCDEEDAWINAVSAFVDNEDPKPIGALLRSGTPPPPAACDLLAELFDPTACNPYGLRLCVKLTRTINQFGKQCDIKWPVARMYQKKLKDKMTVEVASEEVGRHFGISDRTVRRYNDEVAELNKFLHPPKS
jgi:hypothetical protein